MQFFLVQGFLVLMVLTQVIGCKRRRPYADAQANLAEAPVPAAAAAAIPQELLDRWWRVLHRHAGAEVVPAGTPSVPYWLRNVQHWSAATEMMWRADYRHGATGPSWRVLFQRHIEGYLARPSAAAGTGRLAWEQWLEAYQLARHARTFYRETPNVAAIEWKAISEFENVIGRYPEAVRLCQPRLRATDPCIWSQPLTLPFYAESSCHGYEADRFNSNQPRRLRSQSERMVEQFFCVDPDTAAPVPSAVAQTQAVIEALIDNHEANAEERAAGFRAAAFDLLSPFIFLAGQSRSAEFSGSPAVAAQMRAVSLTPVAPTAGVPAGIVATPSPLRYRLALRDSSETFESKLFATRQKILAVVDGGLSPGRQRAIFDSLWAADSCGQNPCLSWRFNQAPDGSKIDPAKPTHDEHFRLFLDKFVVFNLTDTARANPTGGIRLVSKVGAFQTAHHQLQIDITLGPSSSMRAPYANAQNQLVSKVRIIPYNKEGDTYVFHSTPLLPEVLQSELLEDDAYSWLRDGNQWKPEFRRFLIQAAEETRPFASLEMEMDSGQIFELIRLFQGNLFVERRN